MNYNGFLLQSKINLEITYDAPAGSGKGEGDGDEDEAGGEGDLEGEEEGGGCAYSVFFFVTEDVTIVQLSSQMHSNMSLKFHPSNVLFMSLKCGLA